MATVFTSANYDSKSALQLQIEISESGYSPDGTYSTVTANYYFISVNKPTGAFSGDITSDYNTAQSVACSLGSTSKTFSTTAGIIAAAVNKFGDKSLIGSISVKVNRNSAGNASVKAACSCTLTWRSGYPSRSVSGTYQCRDVVHTVTYNANGGTNAPSAQKKYYGYVLNLTDNIPTRSGYKFKGWATSASGSVAYPAGGRYGLDEDTTLYAVWSLTDLGVTLTSQTIRIPVAFFSSSYGFDYFCCDPNYYVDIPYTYTFTGNITSMKATPLYGDQQTLNGRSGTVRVSMESIGKQIDNESSVTIAIQFDAVIDGDTISQTYDVTCPLQDFNFFKVQESSVYISPVSNDLVMFKFLITYPRSFNPNVQLSNAYPILIADYENVLLSVGKTNIDDTHMLVTCQIDSSQLSNGLAEIGYLGKVPLYSSPLQYNGSISVRYPTSNQSIIIKRNGDCHAYEFIETNYVNGFLKGGVVCAKEYIEDERTPILSDNNFKFNTLKEV